MKPQHESLAIHSRKIVLVFSRMLKDGVVIDSKPSEEHGSQEADIGIFNFITFSSTISAKKFDVGEGSMDQVKFRNGYIYILESPSRRWLRPKDVV